MGTAASTDDLRFVSRARFGTWKHHERGQGLFSVSELLEVCRSGFYNYRAQNFLVLAFAKWVSNSDVRSPTQESRARDGDSWRGPPVRARGPVWDRGAALLPAHLPDFGGSCRPHGPHCWTPGGRRLGGAVSPEFPSVLSQREPPPVGLPGVERVWLIALGGLGGAGGGLAGFSGE